MTYAQPTYLDEALELLARQPASIVSGGTDFYPARLERRMAEHVLDIHALAELKNITVNDDNEVRIGAGATWSDIIKAPLPLAFDGLKLAAREVGSVQIQNRATLVGNLCNASPAADGVPPLLILNAQVELASHRGRRTIPLAEFILGNRQTACRSDELVCAVIIPASETVGHSTFLKLGARKYLIISVSMVAAKFVIDEIGNINEAAISVGSCSLVAQRLRSLEEVLIGQPINGDIDQLVKPEHLTCLSPIDDVRSTATYRIDASLELVRRAIRALARTLAHTLAKGAV